MYFVYIDESGNEEVGVFSAIAIPDNEWREALSRLQEMRRVFAERHGVYVRKELHTAEFIAGRGRMGRKPIPKRVRKAVYLTHLDAIADLPGALLFNAVHDPGRTQEMWAFERLLTRINRELEIRTTYAVIFCDDGKEQFYRDIQRRLSVHNPIWSRYGRWDGSEQPTKNFPVKQILEDTQFISSDRSLFIQAVDACAYALLKRECPDDKARNIGIEDAFERLDKILVKKAVRADPEGIIRVSKPAQLIRRK